MDIKDIMYSSEYIQITKKTDGVYIESFKTGLSVDQFNAIISKHPEISISNFMAIKNALLFAPKESIKFGNIKEKITVEISKDELKAYIMLSANDEELYGNKKNVLIDEIVAKLNEKGVVFGIRYDVLGGNPFANNKQILIAEGIPPTMGTDSTVEMYKIKEAKPELKESGDVDHYELNLINRVMAGEWLGERRDPTEGKSGKSVKGIAIPAPSGKKHPLFYDVNSVEEKYENGITTLHALREGAVHYDGEKVSVSNHLEIVGDVNFKTGNIDFDGYLTIRGTVEDNFSIAATKDIEILSEYGIGGAKEIVSTEGRIFIKGGIVGKNKVVVKAKNNIFSKFISDATIICDRCLNVGLYCLNSNITAKEVILESTKSQIIGGNINADIRVISAVIGNASEKLTVISIKGFDRNELRCKLEELLKKIEVIKSDMLKNKQEMSMLTDRKTERYKNCRETYHSLSETLKGLEEERLDVINYLRVHGEGEVCVNKNIFPGTVLEIKNCIKKIKVPMPLGTFYYQDKDILSI